MQLDRCSRARRTDQLKLPANATSPFPHALETKVSFFSVGGNFRVDALAIVANTQREVVGVGQMHF